MDDLNKQSDISRTIEWRSITSMGNPLSDGSYLVVLKGIPFSDPLFRGNSGSYVTIGLYISEGEKKGWYKYPLSSNPITQWVTYWAEKPTAPAPWVYEQ